MPSSRSNISTGPMRCSGPPIPATEKVNAWFRGNSPFEKAKNATVAIEVNNIVALSNQSYQIDWTEYRARPQGQGNRHTPLPRHRHGHAHPAAGRGASSGSIRSVFTSKTSTGPRSSERLGFCPMTHRSRFGRRARSFAALLCQCQLQPRNRAGPVERQRGQGHADFRAMARLARLVTKGADGKVIFLYRRGSAIGRLLAPAGLRHRAAGRRSRPRRAGRRHGALEGRACNVRTRRRPGDPSDRQTVRAGLVTSMVVTTSRRTYHIQLKSHQSQYMARVGFEYPEDVPTSSFRRHSAVAMRLSCLSSRAGRTGSSIIA
jgi:hypothetical protein